jgi:hypothetical protein
MAWRKELGNHLLSAFVTTGRALEHAFEQVAPDDWEKLCYRPNGAEPIRTILDHFIAEVGIHRWVLMPDGQKRDLGQLNRAELEAQGLKVVLAQEPTVVAGHAVTSGQTRGSPTSRSPLRRPAWRRAHQVLGVRRLCTFHQGHCRSRRSPASW